MSDEKREVRQCEDIVNVLEERIEELEKKYEYMDKYQCNLGKGIEELEKVIGQKSWYKKDIGSIIDLLEKEIAELRDKLKEFDKIKATNFVEIAHIIDDHTNKLNELKERDLQLREIIRHWNPDIRANSLRLNNYREVLRELIKKWEEKLK